MPPYRVLVVDDSLFMRKIISDLISGFPEFQVVGTANNGREAVQMTRDLRPDVITMDVEMPVMNGLDALKAIMEEIPTPVVMLSSLTEEGAAETIQALEWGAVDFVRKPSYSISLDLFKVKDMLIEKLGIAVRSKVNRKLKPPAVLPPAPVKPRPRVDPVSPPSTRVTEPVPARKDILPSRFQDIVAIGTSTGGPRALQYVLSGLPANFSAPIVIVQHMPPNFTKSLAQRLDTISNIRVVEGEDGMPLVPGTAYVAPGGFHMTVCKEAGKPYSIRISKEEPRSGHRPSVNTLFESLLPMKELKRHIVIMTGMGNDGAKSMHDLKNDGAVTTIAESDETCVVYGMPRAAAESGCVDYLLPVHEIAPQLVKALAKI